MRNGYDNQDTLSFESCSRKMQDKEETTSEASWTAVTKKKGKEVWRLELEGEAVKPEVTVLWNASEGVSVNPEGESHHEQTRAKSREGKVKERQIEMRLMKRLRRFKVPKRESDKGRISRNARLCERIIEFSRDEAKKRNKFRAKRDHRPARAHFLG